MKLADWKKYFSNLDVCQIHDEYVHTSIRLAQKNKQQNFNYIKVQIQKEGEYFFSVVQKHKRFFKENEDLHYKYSYARLFVLKNKPDGGIE